MIDAHQHFWQFDPVRDSWIKEDMKAIQKDFFPEDLLPLLLQNGFNGCVAVQANQSESETNFLVGLAENHEFIKGVVGWVDLQAGDISDRLEHYKSFPVLKGFRHVLQGESQRDLMLHPNFKRGIAALEQYGYTYDILIYPDQLRFSKALAATFPNQKFVIDHIAKPYIRRKEINDWKSDLEAIAAYRNVYCKISGMVTEGDWYNWKTSDFEPYLDAVVKAFGIDRIMFGSDWPVCQVAASYEEVTGIVKAYFSRFSAREQAQFFELNAVHFYGL